MQGAEAWRDLGDWAGSHDGKFGPGIKERFARAATFSEEEVRRRDAVGFSLQALAVLQQLCFSLRPACGTSGRGSAQLPRAKDWGGHALRADHFGTTSMQACAPPAG